MKNYRLKGDNGRRVLTFHEQKAGHTNLANIRKRKLTVTNIMREQVRAEGLPENPAERKRY